MNRTLHFSGFKGKGEREENAVKNEHSRSKTFRHAPLVAGDSGEDSEQHDEELKEKVFFQNGKKRTYK